MFEIYLFLKTEKLLLIVTLQNGTESHCYLYDLLQLIIDRMCRTRATSVNQIRLRTRTVLIASMLFAGKIFYVHTLQL